MTKTFAAIGAGGFVIFTFAAKDSAQARRDVASFKRNSETVDKVRLLRQDDMFRNGAQDHRGDVATVRGPK